MPFGLQEAPATFLRMVNKILNGMKEFSSAYIDDIIVYSRTWEEHLAHVHRVLELLRHAGLTVKKKKCHFGMRKCLYLEHIIGGGEVLPEEAKIGAVQEFPIPSTKKGVHSSLGLTGYFRKFIPDYASVATPLTDLTRKSQPTKVEWTPECEVTFNKLKAILCSPPVLQSPNFEKEFLLQTDASERGVIAVLSQQDEKGQDHKVAFFSRKLLPRETKYATVEKECLAIKLGIQTFRMYLMGREFTIETDHRSLEWFDRLKDSIARLTRWSLFLRDYQFTVHYCLGGKNRNADALSRANPDSDIQQVRCGEGGRSVGD